MTDRLITSREAADLLGLREGTLAAWRVRKVFDRPAAVRVGTRGVRYRESVIRQWITDREERRSSK